MLLRIIQSSREAGIKKYDNLIITNFLPVGRRVSKCSCLRKINSGHLRDLHLHDLPAVAIFGLPKITFTFGVG